MRFFGIRLLSLRITLFTAFLGIVIFTAILNAGISSLHVRNMTKEAIRKKLYVAVGIGSKQIRGEIHAKIQKSGDESSESYKQIFAKLNKIRKITSDIKNVYTIREDGAGGAFFVVDSDPKTDARAKIGHKVIKMTPAIKEAFATKKKITVENNYFVDEWGTFISGFAPIYNSAGEFEALLGMDVMAETVKIHQYNNILVIIFTTLLVTIVTVFLILILSRNISNPIAEVTKNMGKIQKLDFDTELKSDSIIAEISEMTEALKSMKQGLRSFNKYVPTQLVSDLIKLKKEATLEVESRNISILFSDIKDFTSIAEKISPEELAENIGLYFGRMTQAVRESGGIVDKYIGDAIMALWGTPHDQQDHALAACKTALAFRVKEVEINAILEKKGLPTVFTRIGINTGAALVGNIGYDERMSYTAIGDNVNLASRLEGVNKFYKTGIIISEYTYNAVKDKMLARFIDVVAVKGKSEGVGVYELISEISDASEERIERVEKYNSAMKLYIDKKWKEALDIFKTLKTDCEDYPLKIIIERCEKFIANPPAADFVGVINMRDK